ncbi:hypothetical protein JCGZ_20121 [Jatropha curcas]|uniref:Uncharacterized protein n=1 Tax=Jatropha curcas TaxID=180498 RepID=A0A067K5C1_JATCU|nr:hypothetical protein JCGZ_20121 [Jatropha curcas]
MQDPPLLLHLLQRLRLHLSLLHPSNKKGTSGAGPSFQGTSNMSNDEVLARMMSGMDIFDTRLNGMEMMIADRFQSIKIMHGSLDSRMYTMQGQLQTILQLLQPPTPQEH